MLLSPLTNSALRLPRPPAALLRPDLADFSRKILLQSKPHSNDSSDNRVYYQRSVLFRAKNKIKNASITALCAASPRPLASHGPVRYARAKTALRVIDNDFAPGLS